MYQYQNIQRKKKTSLGNTLFLNQNHIFMAYLLTPKKEFMFKEIIVMGISRLK